MGNNLGETLRDIIAALKPGGLALIVCNHPDSDEWRMISRMGHGHVAYEPMKELLDKERIRYDGIMVESSVQLSSADRDTPECDDLLTFYFNTPASALPVIKKKAFWAELDDFSRNGVASKKRHFSG